MASNTIPGQLDSFDQTETHASIESLGSTIAAIARPLASLKFTVVLFALSILIVFFGTLAQVEKDIWEVVAQYFRVPFWPTLGFAWIDFDILFPQSFFPHENRIPGGFYFPGGWLIGALMVVNLLAAHGLRFKIQASGSRLFSGLAVMGVGILMTWLVIASGSNSDGVQDAPLLEWTQLWFLFKMGLTVLFAANIYAILQLEAKQSIERWLLISTAIVLGSVTGWIFYQGEAARLDDSAMRILWQLIKAEFAALVLLAGCVMVFKKRAGIVLLHAGVGLMMFSEFLVGTSAVEAQMRIREGQTVGFVEDIRELELAVIDNSNVEYSNVVSIPEALVVEAAETGEKITHDDLPFDIEVVQFLRNSNLRRLNPDDKNPADGGAGMQWFVEEVRAGTGTDSSGAVDVSAAYVRFLKKGTDTSLGTRLVGIFLSMQDMPETIKADDTTYDIFLRFKRHYKPYQMTLIDVRKDDYFNTNTPRNYSSEIRLVDSTRNTDREVKIWMNNPLRFAGETFYQSSYTPAIPINGNKESTTLQVVTNEGWLIPYVACMIVLTGMLAQFLLTLVRFLNRRAAAANAVITVPEEVPSMHREDHLGEHSVLAGKTGWAGILVPVLVVFIFGGYIAGKARVPKAGADEFQLYQFGQTPIASEGRVKPIDTLARNTLLILSDRQTATKQVDEKDESDEKTEKLPAIQWLIDVIAGTEEADKYEIFRIENLELQQSLGLNRRQRYRYSYAELEPKLQELFKQARLAKETPAEKTSVFQKKAVELANNVERHSSIREAFRNPPADGASPVALARHLTRTATIADELRNVPMAVPTGREDQPWEPYTIAAARVWIQNYAAESELATVDEFAEKLAAEAAADKAAFKGMVDDLMEELVGVELLDTIEQILLQQEGINPDNARELARQRLAEMPANLRQQLETRTRVRLQAGRARIEVLYAQSLVGNISSAAKRLLGDEGIRDEPNAAAASLVKLLSAYREGNVEEFNTELPKEAEAVASLSPTMYDAQKVRFESFFNHFSPFYYSAVLYLIAFVLVGFSWLGWTRPLNRASLALVIFTLCVHTFAIIARIYISGRPPVTNLYSSAVFIGWGCVVLGIVLEAIYRLGIGNIVASVTGFVTLGIAHFLAGDGDTFTVLQAVLDTQFWLATHVVCITLGYATTFMAGMLGLLYVIRGVFTPSLTPEIGKSLARMVYGTLCFAIFFSFVGTVLGGLWADDSWGRFWGWDPKENGALIIVLWNALVLHSRWDGMVKDRGLAVLAIGGNIVTSWSWFGVNELGVGLHSYGFTEGVLLALGIFVASQLAVIAIGSLPKSMWWSFKREGMA